MLDPALTIRWLGALSQVEKSQWNRLASPLSTPFMEWDWLDLLETSRSVGADTGWIPRHLTVWEGDQLMAAAPLYIKIHSEGEFVFDHPWVDLAERMGISYYPKLVGMSPFTPIPGYRFLMAEEADGDHITRLMIQEIDKLCIGNRISGVHFLYTDPGWAAGIIKYGYSRWTHGSFTWRDRDYGSFSDYLAIFKTNQRRNIRREQREMEEMGIDIRVYAKDAIPLDFFPLMHRLYALTNAKFGIWGCKYLTPAFFEGLAEKHRNRLVFVAAFSEERGESPIGMSMLVTKGDRLYGRYWGSREEIRSLHFNVCYYKPIEWAIENDIRYFDPGIGGMHKVRRGFVATPNYSLHRFCDPGFRRIMRHHMEEINRLEMEEIESTNARLPFSNNH